MTRRAILSLGLCLSTASRAFAVGIGSISNEVISARAIGQGWTGVADPADDPMTVYSNPAGLTSLKGTQVTVGMTWENLHPSFKDDNGNVASSRSKDAYVPNVAATQSFLDGKLGAGLAIFSAYGLESHWDGASPLRYVGTNSRLRMLTISPALAYQVHPMLSVGAGADYFDVFDAQLEKHISPIPFGGTSDMFSRLAGDGVGWGYHVGLRFQPAPEHSLGVVYHSRAKIRIDGAISLDNLNGAAPGIFGGTSYNVGMYTDLALPQNIQLGYAFKPNEKWTFEMDTAWYDWTHAQNFNVRYDETNPVRLGVLNTGNPQPLNWRAAWSLGVGANCKLSEAWQLRGGFTYQPYVAPESTFTSQFMDLTRENVTVGAGYAITKSLGLDVAYNAVFFHNRHVNNAVTNVGTYSDFVNILAANLTYRFNSADPGYRNR